MFRVGGDVARPARSTLTLINKHNRTGKGQVNGWSQLAGESDVVSLPALAEQSHGFLAWSPVHGSYLHTAY